VVPGAFKPLAYIFPGFVLLGQMAEAHVQLRAIYLSGDFDRYWEFPHRTGSAPPIPRLGRRSKVGTPI
jgi:hypothetical protein